MNHLQELMVRFLELGQQASEPRTWWQAVKLFFEGSSEVWAAIAAIASTAALVIAIRAIRVSSQTSARLYSMDLESRYNEALFSFLRSMPPSARKFGDLTRDQQEERRYIWTLNIRLAEFNARYLSPRPGPRPFLTSPIDRLLIYNTRETLLENTKSKKMRSAFKAEIDVHEKWIEDRKAAGLSIDDDEVPLFDP